MFCGENIKVITEATQSDVSIFNRFLLLVQKKRLAHAYLFVGPQGVGKGKTALNVAKFINCEQQQENGNFCDACPECVKINGGNHPDIHVIETQENESIKVDQIRELLNQVKLRPFQATRKVFIIRDIEKFTLESSSALLKTLEEPTQNSLLLLTTSVLEKILSTVRSRCHVMHFLSPSRAVLADQLMNDCVKDRKEAHFLAYFAEGCFGKAKKLKNDKILAQRDAVVDRFILSREAEEFAKKILTDKAKTKGFLDILLSWTRDSLLMKASVEDHRFIHADRLHDLRSFSRRFSFEEMRDIHDEVVKTCQLFTENLNVKIPVLIIKEKIRYE